MVPVPALRGADHVDAQLRGGRRASDQGHEPGLVGDVEGDGGGRGRRVDPDGFGAGIAGYGAGRPGRRGRRELGDSVALEEGRGERHFGVAEVVVPEHRGALGRG